MLLINPYHVQANPSPSLSSFRSKGNIQIENLISRYQHTGKTTCAHNTMSKRKVEDSLPATSKDVYLKAWKHSMDFRQYCSVITLIEILVSLFMREIVS